jgi:hypothetical protein
MAQFVKSFVQDLTQDIRIRQCGTIVFNADNESNVISVSLYNGTEEYSGGGTVSGACICPDGSTVPLTGSLNGNVASITLTGDCFAFPGQIGIGVQVVSGTVRTTVLKAIYNVELYETDDVIDPGSRITASVGQLVHDIETATATIPASDMAALMSGIAPTFSTEVAYKAGAYVYYNGTLYKMISDHSGTWADADAAQTNIGNNLSSAQETLAGVDVASRRIVMPENLMNPAEETTGLLLYNDGTINTSRDTFKVTGYIAVEPGDTVYLCGKSSSDTRIYSTGSMTAICWYDSEKNYIGGDDYANSVEITSQNARFVRVCYTGSMANATIKCVTLNAVPATAADIPEYFTPYYRTAYDIAESALTLAGQADTKATQAGTVAGTAAETATTADAKADALGTRMTAAEQSISDAEDEIEILDHASRRLILPENRLNPAEVVVGMMAAASGAVDTTKTAYKTSGFIAVTPGDTVYLCAAKAPGTYIYNTGTITTICLYSAEQNYLSGENYKNAVEITNQNARFVRVCYGGSAATADVACVTLNGRPLNYAEVTAYEPPYYEEAYDLAEQADTKANQALDMLGGAVNANVIDCWGDSRTAMVATTGTSYCDYLLTKLGNGYQTTNYGITSEASGMCAARLGSNEVFVTLENNVLKASGESKITGIYVTSGIINNFFCYSTTYRMPCTIKGIRGSIYKTSYSNYSTCAFVRDEDGAQVTVYPRTKIEVADANSKRHACILWWGKNDMGTASAGRNAISSVYDDAVRFLGHDRFIILGETMSLTSDYDPTAETHTAYTFVNAFNERMADHYPDNFIDINAWLSSTDALTSVGLTPTADDTAFIAKNWPAYQLMVYSTDQTDFVHPNEKGREAIANRIYAWMQEHNWI